MKYWQVRFDDRELVGQNGWLELDDANGTNRLFTDDGTLVTEGISYTPIDTDPTPPSWATP